MKHPGMINKVYNLPDEIFDWSQDNFERALEMEVLEDFIYENYLNGE